jgi:hypothetical protein
MPAHASYDYAVVRVVPRVDREEFINAGVILFSKACHFLAACVEVDENVCALSPRLLMWTWCGAISMPSRASAPAKRTPGRSRVSP